MYVFHVSSYFSKGGQLIGEPINCCLWLSLGGKNDFPELASLLDRVGDRVEAELCSRAMHVISHHVANTLPNASEAHVRLGHFLPKKFNQTVVLQNLHCLQARIDLHVRPCMLT
ncbi:hypothetical protein VPH35_083423 [Triticum aestivum]|uniref:Uncharacterized protein n=1 Tax=Triticum urartu TaxID=4572 RepID=A0A8R7UJB0_TRIUA